jgi:hypothetical protein
MKYEWKKVEKNNYLPKESPSLIEIPKMNFFVIDGVGDPNTSEHFRKSIEALYGLSYTIKMSPKKGIVPDGYYEYTVFPLEGIWDINDKERGFSKNDKDNLKYSLMIRQPDFVTNDLASKVIEELKVKKPNEALNDARFEQIEDGLCVQMMHIGSFDDEPKSFSKMEEYCKNNNLIRTSLTHREIYLSDPRKSEESKRRTVIRFSVRKIA